MRLSLGFLLILCASIATADLFDTVEHRYAKNGDTRIHYVVDGDANAPLIVFVHGFPDFWYSWRHQMETIVRVSCPTIGAVSSTPAVLGSSATTFLCCTGTLTGA